MDLLKGILHTRVTSFWLYTLALLLTLVLDKGLDSAFPILKNYWLDLIIFMAIFYVFYVAAKAITYFYRQHSNHPQLDDKSEKK